MKTYLFIDGTNLYAAQYELFGPKKYLSFSGFIKEVEKKIGARFNKIYFYASYSPKPEKPTKKQKLYLKNEALFYRNVKRTKNTVFFRGYRSKTSGKEKEVDVKLTADIISFGFLDEYNFAYLFTGDADFLQALFTVRRFCPKKKLNLVCLENKIMYQGLFFFKTLILVFKKHPKFKRRFKHVRFLKLEESKVAVKI